MRENVAIVKVPCQGTSCITTNQVWPTFGILKKNIDLRLTELMKKMSNDENEVYSYVIRTIDYKGGRFDQSGSAPNFQGDIISLCTCKHYMRTFRNEKEWIGQWIAGFMGKNKIDNDEANYLVYLMKVQHAAESFSDLWYWMERNKLIKTQQAKSATIHPSGDMFEPMHELRGKDRYISKFYVEPNEDHTHRGTSSTSCKKKEWQTDDIECKIKGRRPFLLVGNPHLSFLWRRPLILLNETVPRHCRKDSIPVFSSLLSQ